MIQFAADLLTMLGLVGIYIAAAVGVSIAGTAALLKIREMWRR